VPPRASAGACLADLAGPAGLPAADVRPSTATVGIAEDQGMDKKAKTPKKPKQAKAKGGADKAK
jgi:hypothetical protein